jgi:hypothetical protein
MNTERLEGERDHSGDKDQNEAHRETKDERQRGFRRAA